MKKLVLTCIIAVSMLSACGGSSKSDASVPVAVVETTVASTPEAVDETVDEEAISEPSDADIAAAAAPPSLAPGEGVDPSASLAELASDPSAALSSMLGVTDPKDLECIQKKVAEATKGGSSGTTAVGGIDPNLIAAVLQCEPPAIVDAVSVALASRLPTATPEQAKCAAKASVSALSKRKDLDISAMMSGDTSGLPNDLQAELIGKLEACGLSAANVKTAAGL